ncbi:MAG: hypothetical protein GVY33_04250 [Alphaproteobacteria bacterium]|jgi:hypothetical protein|nr:hypothetical protein [Alphaproteobacteria bacterium]
MKRTITLVSALLLCGPLAAQQEFFSEAGEFGGEGDNRHTIPVEAGMAVEVIVIGEGVDTTLEATLPSGETIRNDDYQDLNAGFMRSIDSAGDITVVASPLSFGTTGSYRVVARTVGAPGSIEVGQTVQGNLTTDSGAGDRYELTAPAGTRVAIDLKSYDFDAYLTLLDGDGNESTDDDGGDQGYNSRLYHEFSDGETVTITAGSLSSESGRYELIVTELSSEATARHTGNLSSASPRGYDGTRYERHEFEGEAGETLTVELKSQVFDPVLYIANPDGSNLVRDDDGGDGNNSLTVTTLPTSGTYTIYVTSFGDAQGAYELTIYR